MMPAQEQVDVEGRRLALSNLDKVLYLRLRERAASGMLLAGLPNGEWHYLNLLRKVIGGREIGLAVYEDAADDEY
jgi:hypothetical protein